MKLSKNEIIVLVVGLIVIVGFGAFVMSAKPKPDSNVTNTTNSNNTSMEKVATNGSTVSVNYIGKLENGTKFDSSYDRGQPIQFTLGAGQVIAGWDEGILGMKVGEKKNLVIPPEKGYGAQAVGPIPANSTLIFDVELVDVQ